MVLLGFAGTVKEDDTPYILESNPDPFFTVSEG